MTCHYNTLIDTKVVCFKTILTPFYTQKGCMVVQGGGVLAQKKQKEQIMKVLKQFRELKSCLGNIYKRYIPIVTAKYSMNTHISL